MLIKIVVQLQMGLKWYDDVHQTKSFARMQSVLPAEARISFLYRKYLVDEK